MQNNSPIIIANTKAYIDSLKNFYTLQENIWQQIKKENYKYYIALPAPLINIIHKENYKGFTVGAQNFDLNNIGPYTSQVTLQNIIEAGAKFVILGHSEVRTFGEADEDINKKIKNALHYNNILTVLCIGEKSREGDVNGEYIEEVKKSLEKCLEKVDKNSLEKLIIAYEPVWAIGGNSAASSYDVQEIVILIRRTLVEKFGIDYAKRVKIIYGGSVDEDNAKSFLENATVDGVLVGRACMQAEKFAKIVNSLYEDKK
jgi:triosephosphate isomerase (TIM)